jgi:hypothetical protein
MSRTGQLTVVAAAALLGLLLWYSQTRAFAWDEGYHLAAAQVVKIGRRPYLDFCFPQTPLNTYWNAAWMRVLGESWRAIHAVAAVMCWIGACLTAGYVRSRFPDAGWREIAALGVLFMVGLNVLIVQYGPIGQAYAFTLVMIVAAFRLTVKAVESDRPVVAGFAGLAAGCGAAATLLSAPVGLVLLVWLLCYNQSGNKWKKAAALIAGEAAAFLPLFVLFVQGPRQVWFSVIQYQLLYRQVAWAGAIAHDFTVWIAWLDSSHGLLLALFAAGGLLFVKYRSGWTRQHRAEFYLAAWIAAALMLHISNAHPTFHQYYMLAVPFLGILAAAGIYALDSRLWVAAVCVLVAAGLAKTISEENAYTWRKLEPLAQLVDRVTPKDAPIVADENIYFLTHRTPPSGMESNDSHKLDFPKEKAAQLHLLSEAEVERRIEAGEFATVESCGEYEGFEQSAAAVFKQKAEAAGCKVWWDRK